MKPVSQLSGVAAGRAGTLAQLVVTSGGSERDLVRSAMSSRSALRPGAPCLSPYASDLQPQQLFPSTGAESSDAVRGC